MASVSAADLLILMHITTSDITAIEMEKVIDTSIQALNLYNKDLSLSALSGTAGVKTLTVSGETQFAIYLVARTVYYSFYKNISTATVGGVSVTTNDMFNNNVVLDSIREASKKLSENDWSRAII